jgi:hypothetical protein
MCHHDDKARPHLDTDIALDLAAGLAAGQHILQK